MKDLLIAAMLALFCFGQGVGAIYRGRRGDRAFPIWCSACLFFSAILGGMLEHL